MVILFILLGLVWLGLSFLMGVLALFFMEGGPSAVLIAGLMITGAMSSFAGWIAYVVFDDEPVPTAITAVVVALVTIYPAADTLLNGHAEAAARREVAPIVRTIGLKYFDAIDIDKDNVITDSELSIFIDSKQVSGEDLQAISDMRYHESDVGHVTSSTTVMIPITNIVNNIPIITMVPSTINEYGINRADLESYPERITQKFREW